MSKFRVSPAMVVAVVALFVAMGGVGYAAATISSGQIVNNSVRGKDIRNSTILGKDVGKNTLTGSDVAESKLGKVPSSAKADSASTAANAAATDGVSLASVNFRAPKGTAATEFFNQGGLKLIGTCSAGGDLNVVANSTVNDAAITVGTIDNSTTTDSGGDTGPTDTPAYRDDDDFDLAQNVSAFPGGGADDSAQGSLVYANPNGQNVSVTFRNEEDADALGSANDCFFNGTAIIG